LTEPISRNSNFHAPYLNIQHVPSARGPRAVPIGRNMNKAGWLRLLFEPYD
jgi:hypothetical protein